MKLDKSSNKKQVFYFKSKGNLELQNLKGGV